MHATQDRTLYNEDLAPVPIERRTWGVYNYASLWVAMSVCIPTYMLASGLIGGGINWRAVFALAAGIIVALTGLVVHPLRPLYDYAWFVGSGGVYLVLIRRNNWDLPLFGTVYVLVPLE